jgi:protein-S-isoprenylcysteine O-methyltransferase Ste14
VSTSPATQHAAGDSRRSPLVGLGNFLFRYRNHVFPLVFVAIVFLDAPRYPFGRPGLDRALDAIGILIACAGQALRAAVIGLAYIQRGGRHGKVYAEDLVTDGLFAHSRNPLYVGNIGVFGGLFVVLNSYLGWLVGIPAVLVAYWALVLAEEDFLRRKFGAAYEEYCRDVNRFMPSLGGLHTTLSSMRFHWRRVIRKEYGSTWSWLTVVIGLLFWERLAVEGFDSVRGSMPTYVAAWGGVTALYAIARFMKKTDRLH